MPPQKSTATKKTIRSTKKPAAKPRSTKTTATAKAKKAPPKQDLGKEIAITAAKYLLEKKATHIELLDLRELTSMTDYFIICSGSSDQQVKAIAENVIVKMRDDHGVAPWRSEGWDSLQWVIVDFVDFVVHVFRENAREFYNLERLWADAPKEEIADEPIKKVTAAKKKTA